MRNRCVGIGKHPALLSHTINMRCFSLTAISTKTLHIPHPHIVSHDVDNIGWSPHAGDRIQPTTLDHTLLTKCGYRVGKLQQQPQNTKEKLAEVVLTGHPEAFPKEFL